MIVKALSLPVLAGAALSIPTPASAQSCSFSNFAHKSFLESGQAGFSFAQVTADNSCPGGANVDELSIGLVCKEDIILASYGFCYGPRILSATAWLGTVDGYYMPTQFLQPNGDYSERLVASRTPLTAICGPNG
jgi:hypothetical protein